MRSAVAILAALGGLAAAAADAQFAHPGGPEPSNLGNVTAELRSDPYGLELLISFGTSKGGSAGHLALALSDESSGDEMVYSANFYADRHPKHAKGYYTADLMTRVPKWEYLFGTRSTLGDTAAFGLDYGEIYKRSVVAVRVQGVPAAERQALAAYFARINADYRRHAPKAEYHDDEIRYDYMHFNCAKTIGVAFRHGAGYRDLAVKEPFLPGRIAAAVNANIPTEMALKLMKEWNARGYRMDVVLYKKHEGSTYIDAREEEKVAFGDLPNRFPSVLSLDFRGDAGEYQDYDNLFAMYLLYNLGRYSVRVAPGTQRLEIEARKEPMPYAQAAELAARDAESDSRLFLRRLPFIPKGLRIGEPVDNRHLYEFTGGSK
ncbi:MAG TPA: hypothetical protein VFD95_13015 [Usitatibacter sp.]|nr:hypothetical protein [Usitatibacter sp.]